MGGWFNRAIESLDDLSGLRMRIPGLAGEVINVFVPTTPNPTSGFLLMFPKEDVIYLDITFEQASKFIVSAGSTNP